MKWLLICVAFVGLAYGATNPLGQDLLIGKGVGLTEAEAKRNALQDVSQQVLISVSSSYESSKVRSDSTLTTSAKLNTSAISKDIDLDVEKFFETKQEGNGWSAEVRIRKSDLIKSYTQKQRQALESISYDATCSLNPKHQRELQSALDRAIHYRDVLNASGGSSVGEAKIAELNRLLLEKPTAVIEYGESFSEARILQSKLNKEFSKFFKVLGANDGRASVVRVDLLIDGDYDNNQVALELELLDCHGNSIYSGSFDDRYAKGRAAAISEFSKRADTRAYKLLNAWINGK